MEKRGLLISKKKMIATAPGVGVVVALLVSVIGAAIVAWLLSKDKIDISVMKILPHIIQFVSTIAGCALALLLAGEKQLIYIILTSVGYCILLLTGSMLLSDHPLAGAGFGFLSVLLGTAVSCTFCISRKLDRRIQKRVYS